jgi:hypothetical protein
MAELHVQRKETNVWPWIIGALLVAGVLWFVFMRADTRDGMNSTTADSVYQTQPVPGAPASRPPNTP